MPSLNYHHLLYFRTVAREGTVVAAARALHVTQPTVSAQVRSLERALGLKLFRRSGRRLELTEAGETVYRYAEDIFTLGTELLEELDGRATGRPLTVAVGVADVLPKLVAYRLLEPVLRLRDPARLVCEEGAPRRLLARLAARELDIVLSDSPVPPDSRVRAYAHPLGECGVSVFATPKLASRYRRRFPRSLDAAPFLWPTRGATLRRSLEEWFAASGLRPRIVGEFDDSALLKVFAEAGHGLFAAPDVIERDVRERYGVRVVGRVPAIREHVWAISIERRLDHPAVEAIAAGARSDLFAPRR